MRNCDAFVGKLSGTKKPGDVPVFKSEQDGHECLLLSRFLTERAIPFVEFWEGAIDAVDAGATLTIEPGDIPLWMDGEAK
jgi:hypothetical protein